MTCQIKCLINYKHQKKHRKFKKRNKGNELKIFRNIVNISLTILIITFMSNIDCYTWHKYSFTCYLQKIHFKCNDTYGFEYNDTYGFLKCGKICHTNSNEK